MGFTDVVKRSVQGIGIIGKKGIDAYKYRQSPEFAETQIKKLQMQNRILKEQEERQKHFANIRKAQMQGRPPGGNVPGVPPIFSGNFNMIPGPFGPQNQNSNKKRR